RRSAARNLTVRSLNLVSDRSTAALYYGGAHDLFPLIPAAPRPRSLPAGALAADTIASPAPVTTTTALDPIPATPRLLRAEHVVMASAVLALLVLVLLPLAFLVWGSVSGGDGVTLAHFRDALSSRLYLTALRNSLVLGLW